MPTSLLTCDINYTHRLRSCGLISDTNKAFFHSHYSPLELKRVWALMAGVIISLFLQIRKLKVGEIRDLGKVSGELSLGGTQDNGPQNSSSD